MATLTERSVLSRSGIFQKLTNVLSDVSSNFSSEQPLNSSRDSGATENSVVQYETAFSHLTFRQDLSTLEHIHIRCRAATSFDPTLHTSLCEAVLGIYPDTSVSDPTNPPPILVRGVVEHRHRRIKAGDWLLAINGTRVNWNNFHDFLSKYRSSRKIRLTIRHPISNDSGFTSSLQPNFELNSIDEKLIAVSETLDFIHAVLFYGRHADMGFRLLYQQPSQKDIFFAAGGLFPTLTQLMHDMNENDSLLRSVSIELDNQKIHVCVNSDDQEHYLILIYPSIEHLHVCLLERHTQHVTRLIKFLFLSIQYGLVHFPQSMEYFFQILFYRLFHLNKTTSNIFKHIRLIDEFLPAQFDSNGACPKLFVHDQQLMMNIDNLLNQFECQNINDCPNEGDNIRNRYRRSLFVVGSVLFHRFYLVTSHLTNEITVDVYRFLVHYGYINLSQVPRDSWQCLLFKEIFLQGTLNTSKRSFLLVCCQNDLIMAVVIETEYEQPYLNISPDHDLLQQMKITISEIASIFPAMINNISPWLISSPTAFLKKQLKRTLSLPLVGGKQRSSSVTHRASKDSKLEETISLASSQHPDQSQTDLRASQLISQPESQDEMYKSNLESLGSSALSLDDLQTTNQPQISAFRLHSGPSSTIFYYLDYQAVRGLLIAPYFTLDKISQTTLIERQLFDTIQQTCVYLQRKHFARRNRTIDLHQRNRFSTKIRPIYDEIACQFSISTGSEKNSNKKKEKNSFQFWIVGRKCFQPIEHEFFVCFHDSVQQNIADLAFDIAMTTVGL